MPQVWKTIPLFISSTFRDMHAERDQLNRVVFPAIEERLKPRRCRVAPIDLRVGVETDSTQTERERELQILKVCLAEIERSRPFLLVLLGDRYGWVPGEDRIKAASSEAGFTPEDNGGSVTALEIEYGLLKKDPIQRRRCLLCLREPLPYGRMPEDKAIIYSDAHATDPGAPDRVARLKKLKAKINADPEIAPHRKPYALDWDAARLQPTDESVEVWGRAVEAELWKLLDEETKSFAAQAEPTWEEQERFAIEEQVERLNGSFVGRQPLIQRALELAGSATIQGAAMGLIFTGGSGTGKSALFARLHHELSQHQNILLLAHAAGVSPKSGQTEWMLRRWIGELGAALGETPEVPENIKPEDLEKFFAQLLHRLAAKRRVVVLVDALNQFFRTERARTVSWLPVAWPANARFIATTIPGEESIQLARRPGLALVDVPPLDNSEAGAIVAQVYGGYRRTPNAEVLRAVLALRQSDGTPAAGNPLWLTLALDFLNLLDADDFTAAEAAVGGSPEEKLRHLLLDRARALPPDMEGLYGRLLAQVEKVAGLAETRAFAALTALSRHGWREEDLEKLLPTASAILSNQQSAIGNAQFNWDPLRFAVLRRCFRAHLVKRGALEQWDFAHATLRQAVHSRLEGEWQKGRTENLTRLLYACGANYVEIFPPETIGIQDEIMWQMLGTRDALRVARYYAQPISSSKMLAMFLTEEEVEKNHPLRQFAISMLDAGEIELRSTVANKFTIDLNDTLAIEGQLLLRKMLLDAAHCSLANLAEADPGNAGWKRDLSVNHEKIGDVLRAQGDLPNALKAFRDSLAIRKRLAGADPGNAVWQCDLSESYDRIGEVLRDQGDLPNALKMFRHSLAIRKCLADANPGNTDWERNLSVSFYTIGDVLRAQGDMPNAVKLFQDSLAIFNRLDGADPSNTGSQCDSISDDSILAIHKDLVAADPSNAKLQRYLADEHDTIGNRLREQGSLSNALDAFRDSFAIRKRLADTDPSNAVWQCDLSESYDHIGAVLRDQGDLSGALNAFQESVAIVKRLADTDPSNARLQRALSVIQEKIGDVFHEQGDLPDAIKAFQDSLTIGKRLADADPRNAVWQSDVIGSFKRLAIVAAKSGERAQAAEYLASAHRAIKAIETNRMYVDKSIIPFFDELERTSSMNYGPMIAEASNPSFSVAATPPPSIHCPAPVMRTVSIEEMREAANNSFQEGLWEVAAMHMDNLLLSGEPIEQVAPKLITCLLNAHEQLSPSSVFRIDGLLNQLESASHAALAAPLRQKLEAKRGANKKPRWKFW